MYGHGEFAKEWLFIDLKSEIMIFKIILSAYWSVLLCNCSNTTNAKVDDSFNYLVPSSEKDIFLSVMDEYMVKGSSIHK